jgi:antirestriction protein ArdC
MDWSSACFHYPAGHDLDAHRAWEVNMAATTTTFAELLRTAVTEPGTISTAYSAFHNYSLGNQLLALGQCLARGIQPGPLATFPRWKELGRHVVKGQHAVTLCMPVTVKRTSETEEEHCFMRFIYKPHWFVLAQTDGDPIEAPTAPAWDKAKAFTVLNVEEVGFALLDGNVQGYAMEQKISVSPIATLPWKTTFHELAHVLLGHTSEGQRSDDERTPRDLRECEAEAVALLCCEALGLPGAAEARGYIQSWWGAGNEIPERSSQKILKVADQILKAGEVER